MGFPLCWPPQESKPIPAPLSSTSPCQRRSPRRALMGDTKELPNTALQGLKMQHPKQGLKMQSWGWAGAEGCCPNHSGCQNGILPLPSAVLGGRSESSDWGSKGSASCTFPAPVPPPHPHLRGPPAAEARGCKRLWVPSAYLCDSHAGTPGRCGGAGAACRGGVRGPLGARAAAGRGPARLGLLAAREALGALPAPRWRLSRAGGPRSSPAARRDRSSALARRWSLMSAPNVHL